MPEARTFSPGAQLSASGPGISGYDLDASFSNTVNLPYVIRRFRVGGGAGNVKVQYTDGTDHTITAVQLYESIDAHIQRIYVTGTTATGLQGWT